MIQQQAINTFFKKSDEGQEKKKKQEGEEDGKKQENVLNV